MEGRLHTLQRSTCSCHQRQPFSAMVTVDSSELQKKEELRASKTLGIPCEGRRVDGTLWSGNDKDYKPCPQETHELALSPERQNDTVREATNPGQLRPSMMDPFEAAVVAMRNAQVEIQNRGSPSAPPPNQETCQNIHKQNA